VTKHCNIHIISSIREEMNSRHITILWILYFGSVICITVDDFTRYGLEHGDTRAPTNDDGSTPPIPISSPFPFFNHQHDSLIVSIYSTFARFISTYYFEMCTIKSRTSIFLMWNILCFSLSSEHLSSPGFSGVRDTRSLVLCVCFVDHYWSFSFGHWVVSPSLIYEFWLHLWYFQTLLYN
jgi:hypothetical protein